MEFRDFSLFINQSKVGRFAEDLAGGTIMLTVCKRCGKKNYPPRADCSACMASEMEWRPIRNEGKLASFTKIYVPPDRFGARPPSMPFSSVKFEPCPVGLLEVEDGLRIMGWIPKVDFKKLRIGMDLRALPQVLPDGRVTIILEPV
jgi:hypothetical protein